METINQIKTLICLFFSTNKNLFFERWNFFKTNNPSKNLRIYYFLYFLNHYFINWLGVLLLIYITKIKVLALIPVLILIGKLFYFDINNWQLFFRNDFCLSIPESKKRFKIILLGNLAYHYLVKDNIFIYLIFIKFYFNITFLSSVLLLLAHISVSAMILSTHFIFKIGSLKLKSIYSFISYITTISFTGFIIYLIINGITKFFQHLKNPDDISAIFSTLIVNLNNINYQSIFDNNVISLIFILSIILSLIIIIAIYNLTNKFNSKESYPRLYLLNFVTKINFLKPKNDLEKSLIQKDFRLLFDLYKYEFKKYYYTFFLDRPFVFLIALSFYLLKNNFSCSSVILLLFSSLFFVLDISSSINVKLIANMSFITEYNTLRQMNCNGISIKNMMYYKTKLFYNIRIIPSIIFVLVVMLNHILLNSPLWIIIVNILLIILIFCLYPYAYFINNLIFTKMDYTKYEKYFEETQILENGTDSFTPLSISYKLIFNTSLLSIVLLNFAPKLSLLITTGALMTITSAIIVSSLLMRKIGNNIVSFIERGDYSADFTKIFEKSKNKK